MDAREGCGARSARDLSVLLMELARAVRALRLTAAGDPIRRDALNRCFLAWKAELQRAGELGLAVDGDGFRAGGQAERLSSAAAAELAARFRSRGLERLRLGADLDRDDFQRLAGGLASDGPALEGSASGENAFAFSGRSIAVEGPAAPETEASPAGAAEAPAGEAAAAPSLGSALLGGEPPEIPEAPFEDFTKPALEDDPLRAPPGSDDDAALLGLLRELDACADDEEYADVATAAVSEAARLGGAGHADAAYRAVLVLADHAVGQGGRSGTQLREAQRQLEALCSGARIQEVIERACDPEGRVAVRAAQVLLQLGGRAVGPLLGRYEAEPDPAGAAQLGAIVVALGERAVPALLSAMRGEAGPRARAAVRLAGELQSPELLPALVSALERGRRELRREAARSLACLGGQAALEALLSALAGREEGTPEAAAEGLAVLGDGRAVRPLLARLDDALQRGRTGVARATIAALGRLGRAEASPKLVAIAERRGLVRRRERRELQRAALEALARIPGRESLRALRRAARRRDRELRETAERLLEGLPRGAGDAGAER